MKAYIVKNNDTQANEGAFYNAKAMQRWFEENNLNSEEYTVEALPLQK